MTSAGEQAGTAAEAPGAEEADAVLAQVGALVQAARTRALMTQAMLADHLGVTQTAVSYWEAGRRDMGVAELLEVAEACRVPASSLLPAEHREQPAAGGTGGRFAVIAFMGHNEYTGYVTEIVKNGQPAYRVDLPALEYAASAWFSEWPVTEASVRKAWEAELEAARKRREQEAEWRRAQEQRALTADGGGFNFTDTHEGLYDDGEGTF